MVRSFIRGSYHTSGEQSFERERILDGIRRLVIIEIDVDGAQIFLPVAETLRPPPQGFRRVAALVCAAGAVQADVGEVRGDVEARMEARDLVNAERRIVPPQDAVDLRRVPGRIEQLECVSMSGRQGFQERFQARRVDSPLRWELKHDWT